MDIYIYVYMYIDICWRLWCSGNRIATIAQRRRFDSQRRQIIYSINFHLNSENRIATRPRRLKIFAPTTITVIRCHCNTRRVVDSSSHYT